MPERIFAQLELSERTFRAQYRRETWLLSVKADHKFNCLLVSVSSVGAVPTPLEKWDGFPVVYHQTAVSESKQTPEGDKSN
jgi:hypothetical protein